MIKRGKTRGQVTLFIIIAVVVVAVVLISIIFWPTISGIFMSQQQAQSLLASQGEAMRNAIHDCIESESTRVFQIMGLQAGYYDTSGIFAIDYAGPKYIVMYKDDRKFRVNKLPSMEKMKQEYQEALDTGIEDQIDQVCLNNLASFKRKVNVDVPQDRRINMEIQDSSIILHVDWPIKISKTTMRGALTQVISQKDVELLIPMGRIWMFSNDIVNYETQQINFEDIEDEYNWQYPQKREHLKLDTAHYPTGDQVIYMITTIPYREGEDEYKFYFAVDRL